MTECSLSLTLSPLPKKPVVVTADGGALTSDAGVLLLREVDERLGLTRGLADCLPDRREPAKVRHSCLALLRQRLYQIALGYEDCNDADSLRSDPALKLAVGKTPSDPELASQPTLSRWENQVTRETCWRLSEALLECFLQRHRERPPQRLVLDVDATDDEVHGHQQLSFFHGYYDEHCYLPLLVFAQQEEGGEQELLAALLRPGNVHAGHRAMSLLRRLVVRLREAFPECVIELRADSGLALPEVYEGCEALELPYTISLAKNSRLLAWAAPWLAEARAIHAEVGEKVQVFGAFPYAADSWSQPRRVICKAEVMSQGENPRFVVSSRRDLEPEAHYRFYCQRGDPENRIKELKEGLHADRLSCHRFWANQFRLLLHAAAYVLFQTLRRALAGTELAAAQVSTLRLRLLKVGARIRERVRRVTVSLPSAYPWFEDWRRLARGPT
jgi:Transposase DDE domain group 1